MGYLQQFEIYSKTDASLQVQIISLKWSFMLRFQGFWIVTLERKVGEFAMPNNQWLTLPNKLGMAYNLRIVNKPYNQGLCLC